LKNRQKVLIVDRRIGGLERIAHSPIKAGVALVKKSSRSWRRFTHE
jgi:hypothetical protein